VYPSRAGSLVVVQRLGRRGWRTAQRLSTGRDGSYQAMLSAGRYRVLYGQVTGPAVTIG
jgi:hypothetical protein